ncbi:MAG: 16S rRNA (guanine(966)-N(2))-methyltransferase RsmD [Deltaproteobacteria bacterium]|nr:MAG: 16S rRNA (guanine(966)-N(2))-methyltransferase RsmD [Deltaproteobacteria bacterium]
MRIVGGEARGRTLRSVAGTTTRPTADRVRQSLFDALGQRMDGLAVLDLYAGTGALGLEALSRGAKSAVFVESDARACGVIYGNIADLKYEERARVVRDELPQALQKLRGSKFDLVFSDPPYALRASQAVLDGLSTNDLLDRGARVVLEMDRRDATPQCPEGFRIADERRYGDTRVVIVTH